MMLQPSQENRGDFHGTLGTNIEIERIIRDDGVNEGKLKYTLAEGNFRHDNLPGWDFGFYSAREELFAGNLKHAHYDRGVNAIQEIYINRTYKLNEGSIGWGAKLAGESIDKRTTPEAKIFGAYNISENIDIHGYALYHVEFKRNAGDFPYWEIEPGLGIKLNDNTGAWLNFRYQEGTWNPKSGYREREIEYILKPGLWHNFGKLSASIWGEFGKFERSRVSDSRHLWTESYNKIGISANYPFWQSWRVFGEVSYKDMKLKHGEDKVKFNGYIPLFIAGVNYSF